MSSTHRPKVSLRRFRLDDADRLARLLNDPEVTEMTSMIPYPYARSDAEAYLSDVRNESGRKVSRAIEADGALVGGISLAPRQLGDSELGYWIGREYWGKGIASKAVGLFLTLLDSEGVAGPYDAQTVASNVASQRVLEKNGFRFVGSSSCFTPARETDSKPSKVYVLDRVEPAGDAP
ncbi:MAG: GNAT family N-acetyltransferase [Pseudomonadota bacterium]